MARRTDIRESETWSIAARTVSARVRALPEFSEAREAVLAAALATCRGRNVQQMRELGGFSYVLESMIAKLPDVYRVNVGTPLLPRTVCNELGFDVPAMRAELVEQMRKPRRSTYGEGKYEPSDIEGGSPSWKL